MMKIFCIPIKVEDESDLYDRFLPSGLSFSGELVDYLTDYIEDRKTGEKICIELHAAKEPDMERFRNTYNAYITKLIQRNKRETTKIDIQAMMFMAMGIAFVVIGLVFADRIDRIATEILAAGGSFALWGAIAAFLETLPTLRYKTKLLQRVALKADIRFKREA
jgi:hypothetical protein